MTKLYPCPPELKHSIMIIPELLQAASPLVKDYGTDIGAYPMRVLAGIGYLLDYFEIPLSIYSSSIFQNNLGPMEITFHNTMSSVQHLFDGSSKSDKEPSFVDSLMNLIDYKKLKK